MKNKNVTNLGQFRSDFTLNSPAMSYLGLLFLQFSAVLYFLPEPMTVGLKSLLDLKTKAILLLLTSLFLPLWLGPALASLASLSNNTAGLWFEGPTLGWFTWLPTCQIGRGSGDEEAGISCQPCHLRPLSTRINNFFLPHVFFQLISSQFSPGQQYIMFSPLMVFFF